METLLRFMLLRPASQVDADQALRLDPSTPLQGRLTAIPAGEQRVSGLRAAAREYLADPGYDNAVKRLTYLADLRALERSLRAQADAAAPDIGATIRAVFGRSAEELSGDDAFRSNREALTDLIIAIKLARGHQAKPLADLVRAVRLMALIADVAGARPYLEEIGGLQRALDRPLRLPGPLFPLVAAHESIRPAGVADLLIVRQALKRYQAREISHIENVLRGESKARDHRRKISIDETVVAESETTTEKALELESTERFELQQEVAETVKEDSNLEAGLRVSGRYGPFVEFEASAKGSVAKSKENSTKFASDYASGVTSRSASKLTERRRQQRTRRVLEEVEELNNHRIDNAGQAEHAVGIYQWVEKVYEAQVFNYGLRTIYDFMVPEPAAYFIEAFRRRSSQATQLEVTPKFTLRADEIDGNNYHQYVLQFEATGVQPPPEQNVTLVKVFVAGPDEPDSPTRGLHVDSAMLTIPDGYAAVSATVSFSANTLEETWLLRVVVGGRRVALAQGSPAMTSVDLDSEIGSVAVAMRASNVNTLLASVEITCALTDRAFDAWRQQTHSALLQAYQEKRSGEDAALAALRAQAPVEITGRSPDANRVLERDELRRACISLLTRRNLGQFMGAGFPEIAVTSAELFPLGPQVNHATAGDVGQIVRFFEQAFEWHNLTYLFYPYFWGMVSEWPARLDYRVPDDPLFEAFLRAGAARVVVPVRPGFEAAVAHFMDAGMDLDAIWNGGELPSVGSDLYVPIDVEIREQLGAPGDETPQGEPWEIVVPTSLVLLRAAGSLPRWRKGEDGRWIPDE